MLINVTVLCLCKWLFLQSSPPPLLTKVMTLFFFPFFRFSACSGRKWLGGGGLSAQNVKRPPLRKHKASPPPPPRKNPGYGTARMNRMSIITYCWLVPSVRASKSDTDKTVVSSVFWIAFVDVNVVDVGVAVTVSSAHCEELEKKSVKPSSSGFMTVTVVLITLKSGSESSDSVVVVVMVPLVASVPFSCFPTEWWKYKMSLLLLLFTHFEHQVTSTFAGCSITFTVYFCRDCYTLSKHRLSRML